jgi:MFS family permease
LLCVFSSFGQTFFIALFSVEIRGAFDLTHGEFGWVYMLATIASATTLVFIGKVVDYAPVAWVAAGVCGGLAIMCFSLSQVTTLWGLGVTLFGLRLFGQGLMTHTAMTAMGRWYDRERGRAVSITGLGHQIGEAVMPIVVVSLLAITAWQQVWKNAGLVMLGLALPLIVLLMKVERHPRGNANNPNSFGHQRQYTRMQAAKDPVFWVLCSTTLMPAFIGTSFFFHQQHIGSIKQWSPTLIASAFASMALVNIVCALAAGLLIDRFSARAILPLYLLPLGAACLVLSYFSAPAALWCYMMLLGVSSGFSSTLLSALWPENYGTQHLGAIRSLVMAGMVFSSALGPGITGWFIDQGIDYPSQTWVMALSCLLGSMALTVCSKVLSARAQQWTATVKLST